MSRGCRARILAHGFRKPECLYRPATGVLHWHFLRSRHQPARDPHVDFDEEGARYDQAAEEIVQAVPDQDQVSLRLVAIASSTMTVVPVQTAALRSRASDQNPDDEHHKLNCRQEQKNENAAHIGRVCDPG